MSVKLFDQEELAVEEINQEIRYNNDKMRAIRDSKISVLRLIKSIKTDKAILANEEIDKDALDMAVTTTSIIYDNLGIDSIGADEKDILLSKEGIVDKIKQLFKAKKFDLANSKYKEVVEYVDANYKELDSVKLPFKYIKEHLITLKILGYENITNMTEYITAVNDAEKNILDNLQDNDIFAFSNMLDTKPLKKLGYKISDKLSMFNNKSVDSISNIKINDFIKYDKKNGLVVDEYRILPLGIINGGYVSFYILRYVKNGDLYTMIPRWGEFKIVKNITVKEIDFQVTPSDYENLKELKDNSRDLDIYNPGSDFEEGYDESVVNNKLDKYIESLGSISYDEKKLYNGKGYAYDYFDYIYDWDLEFNSDEKLCEFVCNISLDNDHDNHEQLTYGDLNIKYESSYSMYYDLIYTIAKKLISKTN